MQFTRNDLIHLCFIKKCFDPEQLAHELGISVKTILRKVPELKTSGEWHKTGPRASSGRPCTAATDPLKLRQDSRLSYRGIAKTLNVSVSTAYRRINEVRKPTPKHGPEPQGESEDQS